MRYPNVAIYIQVIISSYESELLHYEHIVVHFICEALCLRNNAKCGRWMKGHEPMNFIFRAIFYGCLASATW